MDSMTLIAITSIVIAGITTGVGCMAPAFGEGKAVASALTSLAQQPDASPNPFWNHFIAQAADQAAGK